MAGAGSAQDFDWCITEWDGPCYASWECCDGNYCIGNEWDDKYCSPDPGTRGKWCTGQGWDLDCLGNLICAEYGSGDDITWRCSECQPEDHVNDGLAGEGEVDDPEDVDCLTPDTTCSCISRGEGFWYDYAFWSSYDDLCDTCESNYVGDDQCYEGKHCNPTEDGVREVCFNTEDQDCCNDQDCNSGRVCTNNICVTGTPTTTTTTTTSTTTTLGITNFDFNCVLLVNLTSATDDVYEEPGLVTMSGS